ncbi:MAG: helix-turn-helix domain-containing protein [Verrucomicrobia bacterium]|jgi:excisionase family DNA binding protein|nr:helix-turn-helix domain-containing protein [Verrucomicrobiota bacterium]
MSERWLSVEEIAAHLGVSTDAVYKWIYRKKMPAHKLGRLWKFLASEVDQWIKAGHAREDVPADASGITAKQQPPGR